MKSVYTTQSANSNNTPRKQTTKKTIMKKMIMSLMVACAFVMGSNSFGQQVIGSFPTMDGGFENETSIATQSSIASGSITTAWLINSTSTTGGAVTNTVTSTGGRSGPKYITLGNTGTSAIKVFTPTASPSGAIVNSTSYTVQYYYRTSGSTAVTNFQRDISPDGTGSTNSTYATTTMTGTSGTWTLVQQSFTSGTSASSTKYGIGVLRMNGATAVPVDIDDYVMYLGAADNTAPNSPTAVTVTQDVTNPTTALDVAWSAPTTGGVDGGGYVVVRYTTAPVTADVPNANGIYAVGNTITVTNTGTVVYIGNGTSFTDGSLTPGATYYYKIYAVDKAFNYSAPYSNTGTSAATVGPVITTGGSLSAVNTTYGTASATPTSFTVSGTNMSAGILVTPPSGYEVSQTVGGASGYAGNGVAITVGSSGTIASTTVYVRLAANAPVASSPFSGNITLTSTYASNQNVATVSSTVTAQALTITANDVPKAQGATLSSPVTGSTAFTSSGLANSETIGSVTITYSGTGPTAGAANGTYTNSVTPSAATGGTFTASNYSITYNNGSIIVSTPATLSSSGTLAAVNTTFGSASPTPSSFTAIGGGLTSNIIVTPPVGFEVATTSDFSTTIGTNSSPLALVPSGGTVNTLVYVRLSAASTVTVASSPYSGNIVLSNATSSPSTVNVATASSTVSPLAITVTANSVSHNYGTTITGGSGSTAFTTSPTLPYSQTIGSVTVSYNTGHTATDNAGTYSGQVTPSLATGGTFTASNYTITYANGDITVNKIAQTITFAALPNVTKGTAPYALTATATSGGTVSFASSDVTVATFSGSTITIIKPGTITITASQAGNTNYNAATNVTQQLIVTDSALVSWDFTTNANEAPAVTHVTVVEGDTLNYGNAYGTIAQFLNSTSASTTYTGASGGNNAGLAANIGALNTSTSPYYEFSLTPASGYTISATYYSFGVRSTGTGPQAYSLRYSGDGYTTDLATGAISNTSVWAQKSGALSLVTSPGDGTTPIVFRLYLYNGAGSPSSGSINLRIDDYSVNGYLTYNPSPILTASTTSISTAFSQTATPTNSNVQSYTIAGQYLDNDVIITPPVGFDVSTTSTFNTGTVGTNASPLDLPKVAGSQTALQGGTVTIYVRLDASTTGAFSGNIVNNTVSNGPPTANVTKNVAVTGSKVINYYNIAGANVDLTTSWGTNPDGSNTHPSDFTSAGQTFNIVNGSATMSTSTTWTVSGSGSKIILGNGTTAVSLTVPSTSTIAAASGGNGMISLANNSTLILQNTTLTHTYGTIATGSTINYAQASAFNIPSIPQTGLAYSNVTLSGTGPLNFSSSETLTVPGNLSLVGPTTYNVPSGFATFSLGGNLSFSGVVTGPAIASTFTLTFTGAASSTQTITSDGVSALSFFEIKTTNASTVKLISTTSTHALLSLSDASGGGIVLAAGSTLNLNGNDLTYPSGSGAGICTLGSGATVLATSASNISIYKANATALSLFPSGQTTTIGNLTLTGTTALTLLSPLNVTGILTVSTGTTLTTGGYLTLKSTSIANSAVVGLVGGTISGNVTVERYIPSTWRAFRDLGAAGVYASGNTIYNTWQNSGSYSKSGYGLFITGATSTAGSSYSSNHVDNGTGGTYLDYSLNSYPSAYYWNATKQSFDTIKNTNTTSLNPFQSYRVLVRGDRGFDLYTTGILNYPNGLRMYDATTLSVTGNLIYGNVTYSSTGVTNSVTGSAYTSSTYGLSSAASGYSYITNPYDCPIDFHNIYSNGRIANMIYGYWYLDPTVAATGAYVAYNAVAGTTNTGYSNGNLIQAGQGFLVANYNVDGTHLPSIQITENDKSTASSSKTSVFGAEAPTSKLFVGLLKESTRVDGVAIVFGNKFSNGIGLEDSRKLSTGSDNLSIKEGSNYLSIEGRLPATSSDVLNLEIAQPSTTAYQLRIDASGYINEGFIPLLLDAYKSTTTALSGIDTVSFTVDAKTSATYANRFSIIFTPSALAVNSIVASATLNNKIATITWNTIGEKGESYYEVEKSTDAITFVSIGKQAAKNTSTASYTATDNSVVGGNNYYRIKAVSVTGAVSYSNVAKLQLSVNSNQFAVYPNPLVGKTLNIEVANVSAGKYVVSIYNVLGQKVAEQSITHSGGNATHALTINNMLAKGIYSVTIREASSNQIVHQTSLSVQP